MQKIDSIIQAAPLCEMITNADDVRITELAASCTNIDVNHTNNTNGIVDSANQDQNAEERIFLVKIKRKPKQNDIQFFEPPLTDEKRTFLLRSAELLLREKDYILARHVYSYLLKVNIHDTQGLKGLGICFLRLGDAVSAKKCFSGLGEIDRGWEATYWMTQCYSAENRDDRAANELAKLGNDSTVPSNDKFMILKDLGNCHTRLSRWNDAATAYQSALGINADSDAIYTNLGILELQRSNATDAVKHFKKALELNPKNARSMTGLGLGYLMLQNKAEAKRMFFDCLAIDSYSIVSLTELALLADTSAEQLKVENRLKAWIDKDAKDKDARYAIATLYFNQGQWKKCTDQLNTLLSLDPNFEKARKIRSELEKNKCV